MVCHKQDIIQFRKVLLLWFETNQRRFPWRKETVSNYELIISEVLLQRTKAETVARYYDTFFGRYPDWNELIKAKPAELEEILKPLGLYRHRAKRLTKIIEDYITRSGVLPRDIGELQETSLATLYIANAYELFILNHRAALLDVNMSRVLGRYFFPRVTKDLRNDKIMQALAREVTNVRRCKELNWAILDYAALVCTAVNPKCEVCKLKSRCKYQALRKNASLDVA